MLAPPLPAAGLGVWAWRTEPRSRLFSAGALVLTGLWIAFLVVVLASAR